MSNLIKPTQMGKKNTFSWTVCRVYNPTHLYIRFSGVQQLCSKSYLFLSASFAEHVRLVNGSNRCSGRVEVYQDDNWKRVCRSDWGKEEADVVCKEINCGTPVIQTTPLYFGEALEMIGVKTDCFGNESSVSQCTLQEFKESCSDATLVCASK